MTVLVNAFGSAVTTASRSPAITFSNYKPRTNDVVAFFAASGTAAAAATAPTNWVLPTPATGANPVASDSHTYAFTYHVVTAAEETASTTTYTATNLWNATQTGNVVGLVLRGVDTTAVIDSLVSGFSSTNTATPHVFPALTGANLSTGSLVVGGVASDGLSTYTTPAGWMARTSFNTNQGNAVMTSLTATTSGTNVAATNVTPSVGDEYCAFTVAFTALAENTTNRFLTDEFVGADGSNLTAHTADSGGTWAKETGATGDFTIQNNRVYSSVIEPHYVYSDTPPSNDYVLEAEVTILTALANSGIGMAARASAGAQTFYVCSVFNISGSYWLYLRRVTAGTQVDLAGSPTQLATQPAVGTTHRLKLTVNGSSLTVSWDDDATSYSATDTNLTTGLVGLGGSNNSGATTGPHMDRVIATSLGGSNLTSNPTDNVGITDAVSKDVGRTITDSVTVTDALVQDAGRTTIDAVGLTDSLSKDLGRTTIDPVGLSDALARVADYVRGIVDSVGVTDATSIGVGRQVTDAVGVTDSLGVSADWVRVANDQVGITDAAEFTLTFARIVTDTVGLTDAAGFSADVVVEATDQVGITDSIELAVGQAIDVADEISITDASSFNVGAAVEADDQVNITDSLQADVGLQREETDDVELSDSFEATQNFGQQITEPVAVTDSLELTADWFVEFTEDVGITDIGTFVLIPAGDIAAIDLIGISDEAIFSTETAHETDDQVGVADGAQWEQGRSIIDSIGLSDDATFNISIERAWTDEVGIADSAQFDAADLHIADPVGITDDFTLSGLAENRLLVAEPENRLLVAEPENRLLVAEPENRLLVAEAEDRMLVAEPEDRLLRGAAEQRTFIADDGIP